MVKVTMEECSALSYIKKRASLGPDEEAFYVCDLGAFVIRYQEWCAKLQRVEPFYAVKCNDTYQVLEVLAALGCSFDCASKGEIERILDLGVTSDRIIYASPCKMPSHIRYSASVGIQLMTFDNEIELRKVKAMHPNAQYDLFYMTTRNSDAWMRMILRFKYEDPSAMIPLGGKFGCDPVTDAPRLLRLAQQIAVPVVGVSFHVGSGSRDPTVFHRAISTARSIFDMAPTFGHKFHLLDIGGGYPGNEKTTSVMNQIAVEINQALNDFFPDNSIRVVGEPGRYMAASAFTLATQVHSKRTVMKDQVPHHMYYINAGVYGGLNSLLYEKVAPVPLIIKDVPGLRTESSSIWGPTNDSIDIVCPEVQLPALDLEDWIVFENLGAYSITIACSFNGFPPYEVHTIASKDIWKMLEPKLKLLKKSCLHLCRGENFDLNTKMNGNEHLLDTPTNGFAL